jgi:hypothetical protein
MHMLAPVSLFRHLLLILGRTDGAIVFVCGADPTPGTEFTTNWLRVTCPDCIAKRR